MADEEVIVEDGESEYEPVTANGQEERQAIDSWSFYDILQVNPWLLAILAFAAYYVYQNYLSKLKFSSDEARITQNDENRMQQMMEVRNRQQRMYTEASLEMEEKRKNEPPPKVGPISKQIAAKAKLRSEYNPLMGNTSSSGANSINSRYGGRRGGG